MNENIRLIIDLAFLGLLAVSLGLFAFWNIVIKKNLYDELQKKT
jgi:hypothetical protein